MEEDEGVEEAPRVALGPLYDGDRGSSLTATQGGRKRALGRVRGGRGGPGRRGRTGRGRAPQALLSLPRRAGHRSQAVTAPGPVVAKGAAKRWREVTGVLKASEVEEVTTPARNVGGGRRNRRDGNENNP